MTVGVMQPYFFPYLPYFQLIKAVDKFVLLDDVNYINKGYINRNETLAGKFTISLKQASQNKLIKDHVVDYSLMWSGPFFTNLATTYLHFPNFKMVRAMLERVLDNCNGKSITDINQSAIREVCQYLDIQTQIVRASENYEKDGPGQYRILSICKQENATRYINAEGGKALYDKNLFADRGIDLKFIKGHSTMSMIDVLMRLTQQEIKSMLNDYELE